MNDCDQDDRPACSIGSGSPKVASSKSETSTSRSNLLTAIALVGLLGACTSLFFVCGKTGKAPPALESPPNVQGTYCETLARLPTAHHPRGPLPDDPVLKKWTTDMESATEAYLAHRAISDRHSRANPPDERESACLNELTLTLRKTLPEKSRLQGYMLSDAQRFLDASILPPMPPEIRLRTPANSDDTLGWLQKLTETARYHEGSEDSEHCRSIFTYLKRFPDNARLKRGLALHFGACVEDNFNSIDGELDRNEVFFRLTATTFPERLGVDFMLVTAADDTTRMRSGLAWSETPFGRLPIDLGMTGNGLKVVRDVTKERPELAKDLLPTASRWATEPEMPVQRRARWVGLAAYLEAGTPDPGEPETPALIRAIDKDVASARWALAFLPNELQEHAPRPYPYIKDAELIRAVTERLESLPNDEDVVLALDVLSRMPPGTGLRFIAKKIATQALLKPASSAIYRQIAQLEIADPYPMDSSFIGYEEDNGRKANIKKFLAPVLPELRAALLPSLCDDSDALTLLVRGGDPDIDAEYAACALASPSRLDRTNDTIHSACSGYRELGWKLTAKALEVSAPAGPQGDFQRRIANDCRSGH